MHTHERPTDTILNQLRLVRVLVDLAGHQRDDQRADPESLECVMLHIEGMLQEVETLVDAVAEVLHQHGLLQGCQENANGHGP
jgi:hypothetical protein